MSNTTSNVTAGKIALHTLLVLFTGGFWFIVLAVWAILKFIQKN